MMSPALHLHRPSDSKDSIPLSPYSAYSETDPFLSPRLPQSQPGSPFLRPSSPRTPTSGFHSPLNSPSGRDNPSQTGFFDHLPIPPTTKRARSRTWVLAAGGLVFFAVVALSSGGISEGGVSSYSSTVSSGLEKVKSWSGDWTGGKAVEAEQMRVLEEEALVKDEEGELPEEIRISTLPKGGLPDLEDESARYLGFLPHSGYHNQRIALQNALLLGKLLNRTVLLPPVWIGWPVPTQYYSELRQSWLNIMLLNQPSFNLSSLTPTSPLNLAGSFASSAPDFPCPSCDADNSTLLAERDAANEAKRRKWAQQGYEVRPDGYPIVPGLDASNCKSYSPECRFTYQDTFLAWDFLVDVDRARDVGVVVVDRWDMRERAVQELLGLEDEDVYVVEDRRAYDFRFTDRQTSRTPLIVDNNDESHWHRDVSIATLRSYPQKLLLVGSLFGSGRVVASREAEESADWIEAFGQAMAFKNDHLLRPARAIAARMGGKGKYLGAHLRVGDGEFQRHARMNSEASWRKLVGEKMGVRQEVLEEMWESVKPFEGEVLRRGEEGGHRLKKVRRSAPVSSSSSLTPLDRRSPWSLVDGDYDPSSTPSPAPSSSLAKRGVVGSAWDWLSSVGASSPSANLRNITCRAPLHSEPRFRAFNTPLYLATDSRSPKTDRNLRPFFDAFPCTFVLSDFDHPDEERNDGVVVRSVGEMGRLVNENDGVPLGRLFLPFLEAMVAAMGKEVVGTKGSTFSAFAESHLHRAYMKQAV
ncbi:hypothetical protein JCM8547_006188 [Rhodosporidiobolus lusitaniae]